MENETLDNKVESYFSPLHRITPVSKYFAFLLFITLPFLGGWIGYSYAPVNEIVVEKNIKLESPSPKSVEENETPNSSDLWETFNMGSKATNTILFYSEELGVGFTFIAEHSWLNDLYGGSAKITTSVTGNTVSLGVRSDIQSIEVFKKSPTSTLEESIRERFLSDRDPNKCFVEAETAERSSYVSATISYPLNNEPGEAWFESVHPCPGAYSITNAIQYFLYNPAIPDKYIFVRVGQDAVTTDGNNRGWYESIQILK